MTTPSRLSAWATSVTAEMLDAYWDEASHEDCVAKARAVLQRRVRELARAIDGDVQGPAQTYLDETPPGEGKP